VEAQLELPGAGLPVVAAVEQAAPRAENLRGKEREEAGVVVLVLVALSPELIRVGARYRAGSV
jgi:hypothetical protein